MDIYLGNPKRIVDIREIRNIRGEQAESRLAVRHEALEPLLQIVGFFGSAGRGRGANAEGQQPLLIAEVRGQIGHALIRLVAPSQCEKKFGLEESGLEGVGFESEGSLHGSEGVGKAAPITFHKGQNPMRRRRIRMPGKVPLNVLPCIGSASRQLTGISEVQSGRRQFRIELQNGFERLDHLGRALQFIEAIGLEEVRFGQLGPQLATATSPFQRRHESAITKCDFREGKLHAGVVRQSLLEEQQRLQSVVIAMEIQVDRRHVASRRDDFRGVNGNGAEFHQRLFRADRFQRQTQFQPDGVVARTAFQVAAKRRDGLIDISALESRAGLAQVSSGDPSSRRHADDQAESNQEPRA